MAAAACARPECIKQWRHLELLFHFEVLKKVIQFLPSMNEVNMKY
jgi:hypothetical protein